MSKSLTILVLSLAFMLTVSAQKIETAQVPAQVQNSFSSMFKASVIPSWEQNGKNYVATFTSGGVETFGVFQADGKFIQYEWNIKMSDLPESAKSYMSSNFSGKSFTGSKRIKNAAGLTSYEITTADGKYTFDDKGNFVSAK